MGLFDLFRNKQAATPPKKDCIDYCNEEWWADAPFGMAWVRIDAESTLCQYTRSPDSNYLVAWHGGNGICGDGKLIIANQEIIKYIGNIRRPVEAAIANNGACIYHDCPFNADDGAAMTSEIYIISPSGAVIFGGTAGSSTIGISPDGSYAAYMIEANTLCFVDIRSCQVAWQSGLPHIWPQYIEFDDTLRIITLKYVGKKSIVPRRGGPPPDCKITYTGDSVIPE